ncbi:hypothetical protein Zm00014a_036015 [Zea mays]|jgi:hypothetical protein|uniref:DUF868 family protein n=2 Tax=Zea mays TaxID=4577 RepID=B4FFF6_MAIZE|nr:uncharacterized protein LOC100193554 [Zea mays]ACF80849.1 unknown [Zea mays]ACG37839.1 hypothetical protein [Zea mays]ONM35308.1 hypothetical protein ZEAMMB73_Zm00001d042425 [Zea mays]PWZ33762.1 hypothetical protein Zm00014a_036015 [Zea mays]|eukprot:NP_001132137.1 uncharacterized protein LOC100193554 [Zea mays]
MMQDLFSVPSCFSAGEKLPDVPASAAATTRSGQSAATLVYRAGIAGHDRLVTVTWCRNLLTHGLTVSIEGSAGGGKDKSGGGREWGDADGGAASSSNKGCSTACKVEMQPWHFWRKYGAKQFHVDGRAVDVVWDLRSARYSDEPEPLSDYYVAVVSDEEVVLLLGNLKKEAFRRTGSRPSLRDAALVCKKEHVFSKKRFLTKARFHDRGKLHDISIECSSSNLGGGGVDVDMVIKIDGYVNVLVRHLQWKFRGNECISINQLKVQVYWDAHDWIFGTGVRNALFIFKPEPLPSATNEYSDFCLFLYAWKLE